MSKTQARKKSSDRKPGRATGAKRRAQTGGNDEITQVSFRALNVLLEDMQHQLSILRVENETTAQRVAAINSHIEGLLGVLDCQDNMTFPIGG